MSKRSYLPSSSNTALHIGGEVIVIGGIFFYLNREVGKLRTENEMLRKKMEELISRVAKLEEKPAPPVEQPVDPRVAKELREMEEMEKAVADEMKAMKLLERKRKTRVKETPPSEEEDDGAPNPYASDSE